VLLLRSREKGTFCDHDVLEELSVSVIKMISVCLTYGNESEASN
jgi:hypothetical protein